MRINVLGAKGIGQRSRNTIKLIGKKRLKSKTWLRIQKPVSGLKGLTHVTSWKDL
jgi:hypothetical protein